MRRDETTLLCELRHLLEGVAGYRQSDAKALEQARTMLDRELSSPPLTDADYEQAAADMPEKLA